MYRFFMFLYLSPEEISLDSVHKRLKKKSLSLIFTTDQLPDIELSSCDNNLIASWRPFGLLYASYLLSIMRFRYIAAVGVYLSTRYLFIRLLYPLLLLLLLNNNNIHIKVKRIESLTATAKQLWFFFSSPARCTNKNSRDTPAAVNVPLGSGVYCVYSFFK